MAIFQNIDIFCIIAMYEYGTPKFSIYLISQHHAIPAIDHPLRSHHALIC